MSQYKHVLRMCYIEMFKISILLNILYLITLANCQDCFEGNDNPESENDVRFVQPMNVTEELNEALKNRYLGSEYKEESVGRFRRDAKPDYFSLADQNKLLPIEKQGSCGGCYAFTTVY